MTDPADRFLEDRLHALARGVPVPVVSAEDDVRRGRRRLFRMRVGVAGATTATLAVVLAITGLTAGNPRAGDIPPATQPASMLPPATPSSSPSAEESDDGGPGDHGSGQGAGNGRQVDDAEAATSGTDSQSQGDVGAKNAPHGPAAGATQGAGADPEHQPWGSPSLGPLGTPDPTVTTPATPSDTPTDTPTATPTQTPSATPTESPTAPTETPTATPTESPTSTPTSPPTVPPTQTDKVRVRQVLRYYNDVVTEHLDPDRAHLQPYARRFDPTAATSTDGRFFALGSTFRWAAGKSFAGLGVTVASGWDQVEWQCGASDSDWQCRVPDNAEAAEVATHDGARQVAVERPDGQVVVVTADQSVDRTDDDLVAAASDERLILPGDAPVAPPVIDQKAFADAGLAALVVTDESFDQASIDRSPQVRGTWSVDGVARGVLSWSARPVYAGQGWECLRSYRTCADVIIEGSGTTVHLAAVKAKAGGGWVIEYDGPSYAVRVYSSDRKLPKKRAYDFVTDPAWQPVR